MNRLLLIAAKGMLLACLLALPARAQSGSTNSVKASQPAVTLSNGNGNGNGNGSGNNGNANGKKAPTIANRPLEIPRNNSSDQNSDQKGKPQTPGRPDKTALPTDVNEAVKKYQDERENYLKNSKAAARLQKDATDEERSALRDQMKESLDRLKDQQKALRQEMRDRAKDMKNELSPDLGRVVDGGQNEGRGR
jgi:hypothetical protein